MKLVETTPERVVVALKCADDTENDVVATFDVTGCQEDLAPLFSGPLWSAIVWEKSVSVMCSYLEANRKEVKGKTVVELGCGLGIPGLVASVSCEARKVFLTDRAEDLDVLGKARNSNSQTFQNVEVIPFDWGVEPPKPINGTAEIIFAVECVSADVYGIESLNWLICAIQGTMRTVGETILFLCSARRKDDGLDFVLTSLRMVAREVSLMNDPSADDKVELYRIVLQTL